MKEIAKLTDIPEGTGLRVQAEGKEIALFRVGGQVYAIDPVCPHAGGPLENGPIEGSVVICPWHAWEFDVGEGKCLNTGEEITRYSVEVRDGAVFLV